jgi:predicted alpha/beta superfamily hydrolase
MIKRTLEHVRSPQLGNRRDIDVYLPSSYASGVCYPVVYLQDGQNLSDPATAFAGTWELGAAIDRLAWSGLEAILVGIHHAGRNRLSEYSPFPDARHGGGEADNYLAFVVHTLKPRIDRMFNTRRDRDSTTILGSSMGGLVSLYAYFRYPSVFGRAGAMSPSIWFGQGAILRFIEEARVPRGRIYLDVGTGEGAGALRDVRRLGRLLVRQGFRRRGSASSSALRYVEDRGARHTEGAWAGRLQGALEFLLS